MTLLGEGFRRELLRLGDPRTDVRLVVSLRSRECSQLARKMLCCMYVVRFEVLASLLYNCHVYPTGLQVSARLRGSTCLRWLSALLWLSCLLQIQQRRTSGGTQLEMTAKRAAIIL